MRAVQDRGFAEFFRLGALCLLLSATLLGMDGDAEPFLLAQRPTLNSTHVVFVFGGDLWSVSRRGGEAVRLTAGPGLESSPAFSPDGTLVAFSGEYDGNVDVFVMPAAGGVPERLTWHPAADTVLGWTPDGTRVLFASGRTAYSRFSELFTVGLKGGLPDKLPLPMGTEASFSPDGKRLAYVPLSRAFTAWKRYRGGRMTPVWIADLDDSRVEPVPRQKSNDFNPMWVDDKVYFLSDRDGAVTLFAYDSRTKKVSRAVDNRGLDVKSASAGPGAIVFEQFGSLNLYDLKSGRTSRLSISVAGDFPEVRPHYVSVERRITSADLSPSGARAVFEARGEIVTVPAEKGDARNLTGSPGVMERDPAWSPDGKTIAYFSDESSEYELHLRPQDGRGETVKVALGVKPTFYFAPRWSPDGKKIAFADCHLALWILDLETKKAVQVDKDMFWRFGNAVDSAWSPDSRWLAYARRLPNYLSAVFMYSLEEGRSRQLTDGLSDALYPVFDPDGKYLYFTASTDAGASLQPDIHSGFRPSTRAVYLAVLSEAEPSPFAPESDEEKAVEPGRGDERPAGDKPGTTRGAGAQDRPEDKPTAGQGPHQPKVKVDFEGILQRVLAVPLPARDYQGLQTGKAGTLLAIEAPATVPGAGGPPPGRTVHRFDMKARRSDTVVSGVRAFVMSRGGEKYLYSQQNRWFIGSLKPMPPPGAPPAAPSGPGGPLALATDKVQVRSDPRAEWRQMYREAWRIEREFFYDPETHGYDLAAAEKRYEPFLENIVSRRDLNALFAEMLGGIEVGHLSVGGGDIPSVERVPHGLLGADFKVENGRYRLSRVYSGENWNPQLQAPLTQPGVNVRAGEYLLEVNGRALTGRDSVDAFFENTAGKSVVIKVGPSPDGRGAREVTVVPVADETPLRHFAWIEDNRRLVDRATGGRVAYVYMPDTSFGGYTYFNRYFFAQVGREAAIIDERFNAGGMLATDIAEMLSRRLLSLVASRDGRDEAQPQGAIFGPKVMIINEFAGSGGDAMPYYFRAAGVGRLVGKTTWGGLVGRAASPSLMDGGFVTAPSSGVWSPEAGWIAENVGIAPDIEVEHDPALVRKGRDPQLERAIELVLEALKKNPVAKPRRPAFPRHHGID